MRLAEEVAMLDHLSRGWVACGPGIGVLEHTWLRWKSPCYERRERSREALDIIVKAWTEESVTDEGKDWPFDEVPPVPRPSQQSYAPIWGQPTVPRRSSMQCSTMTTCRNISMWTT
jgi:alkanesulfonate monooxygenase SsuD/methylene tetrahydromethanopterin reductase-like flavin-dependent oxidoreductase (luciferase family)